MGKMSQAMALPDQMLNWSIAAATRSAMPAERPFTGAPR